jgi:hypothetical protein
MVAPGAEPGGPQLKEKGLLVMIVLMMCVMVTIRTGRCAPHDTIAIVLLNDQDGMAPLLARHSTHIV